MTWKKSFIISILITSVLFLVGYMVSAAFFVIALFLSVVITIAAGYKLYDYLNQELQQYFYKGFRENESFSGLIEARDEIHARSIARMHNIILVAIRPATQEDLEEYCEKIRS